MPNAYTASCDSDLLKKRLLFLFTLALVYLFPLLISEKYYADDILHSIVGRTPWITNGRPLSDFLLRLLMAGGVLNDISPMPQILGAAVLSLAAALLSFRISRNGVFLPAIVFFPLICTPYFLENWSFRYDSLPMSVAVATAVAPFIAKDAGFRRQLVLSAVFIFVSLCFYQAASNLFVAFTALFLLLEINEGGGEKKLHTLWGRLFGYIAANGVYYVIAKKYLIIHEYNLVHSKIVSGGFRKISEAVIVNFQRFNEILFSAFEGSLKYYFLLSALLSLVFIGRLVFFKKYTTHGMARALAAGAAIVLYLACFGPLLLLKSPVFSPRVLTGAVGIFVFIMACTYCTLERWKKLSWVIFVPVFGSFVLAYSYYNAARTTGALERSIITEIKATIASTKENVRGIAFCGLAPVSKQAVLARENFPLIGRLVLNDLNQDYMWGDVKMAAYSIQVPYVYIGQRQLDICGMRVIGDGGYYLLKMHDDILIVDYTRSDCR